jgi:hypothetical protein
VTVHFAWEIEEKCFMMIVNVNTFIFFVTFDALAKIMKFEHWELADSEEINLQMKAKGMESERGGR